MPSASVLDKLSVKGEFVWIQNYYKVNKDSWLLCTECSDHILTIFFQFKVSLFSCALCDVRAIQARRNLVNQALTATIVFKKISIYFLPEKL